MTALTLTDFLRARLDERDARARAAIDPARPGTHWQWVRSTDDVMVAQPAWQDMPVSLRTVEEYLTTSGVGDLPAFVLNGVEVDDPRALPHIAINDPAYVLADVDAKRRLIAEYEAAEARVHDDDQRPEGQEWNLGRRQALWQALRLLALPDASHPDYRSEWAP